MPIEYMFEEPNRVNCIKVKLPVVLAEAEAQIVVDNTTCLPELAKKIDHIDVMVQGLEADPVFVHENESSWSVSFNKKFPHHHCERPGRAFVKKVIVHGVLHKQIYFVNQNDDVRHFGEDIPFTKMIELSEPEPVIDVDDVTVTFPRAKVDISWELVRASRLQQTGIIIVRIKVVEERQIFIQTCPPISAKCPKGNLLRDPGFEQWVGNVPILWGSTNVARDTTNVHGGTSAVLLGAVPGAPAAVFQNVLRVSPENSYRLCFWARLAPPQTGTCSTYDVTASVVFYDADGEVLASEQENFPGNTINTAFRKFCSDEITAPDDTNYAQVLITFNPTTTANTCQVIIDDASFECVSSRPR